MKKITAKFKERTIIQLADDIKSSGKLISLKDFDVLKS